MLCSAVFSDNALISKEYVEREVRAGGSLARWVAKAGANSSMIERRVEASKVLGWARQVWRYSARDESPAYKASFCWC